MLGIRRLFAIVLWLLANCHDTYASRSDTSSNTAQPKFLSPAPTRNYPISLADSRCAPQAPRTDCGYLSIQQAECEVRGCCWSPTSLTSSTTNATMSLVPPPLPPSSRNDLPWCYFPNDQQQQAVYEVESVNRSDPGGTRTTLVLRLRPGTSAQPELGPDFPRLEVLLEQQQPHRLYVRVQPLGGEGEEQRGEERGKEPREAGAGAQEAGMEEEARRDGRRETLQPRWRVPNELLPRPPSPTQPPTEPLYHLGLPTAGQEFSLRVTRTAASRPQPPTRPAAGATNTLKKKARQGGRRIRAKGASGRGSAGYGDVGEPATGLAGSSAPADEVLLALAGAGCLVFKPQYLQLRADVASEVNLYGMGETTQAEGLRLRRDGAPRALWNSDTPAAAVGVNLYGSHPVLYGIGPGGASFGWFLANSDAMDVAAGSSDVTFRLTGGILELYLFAGPDPEAVAAQYQEVVGRPAMPPRWALGFHQSRYGYGSVDELVDVAASYDAASIPLEVVWSDIDYTDRARMFVLDPQHYPAERLRAFVDSLHSAGRRWVPIVDCGITALPGEGYVPYDMGLSYDVFIRDSTGRPLLGQVWSGPTHWPDFLHPNATPYWKALLTGLHDKVPYDGIWLDMNEPSNFCTGECRLPGSAAAAATAAVTAAAAAAGGGGSKATDVEDKTATLAPPAAASADPAAGGGGASGGWHPEPLGMSCALECSQPSPSDPLANPPYRVNNGNRRAPLYGNTLPMNAVGYGNVRQYDAHNLYALAESRVTYEALRAISPGRRPFILTRSSWSGQGRYAAHWTGDNAASWDDLRRSPGGLLAASLAGVALAGADICGFMGATNEQLCARWLSAGAFYTFSRDHSDRGSPPQEPYRWPAAAEAARNALRARYTLLPYLYTCFYRAHTAGGTVARPLAWAAPTDPRVADLTDQWLLGDALMVAPVMAPDTDGRDVYFPGPVPASPAGAGWRGTGGGDVRGGTWCRFDDLTDCFTGPSQHRIQSPLGSAPPLFLRSGAIVPTQPHALNTTTTATTASNTANAPPRPLTTAAVAASPLTFTVLLSAADPRVGPSPDDWVASGSLYADDGERPDVGGPRSLRAVMAAGASLAAGTGWFEYRVEPAPEQGPGLGDGVGGLGGGGVGGAADDTRQQCNGGGEGGGGRNRQGRKRGLSSSSSQASPPPSSSGAQSGTSQSGADADVAQLRVEAVVVVGVPLPHSSETVPCSVEVAVEVAEKTERGWSGRVGAPVPVPPGQVHCDPAGHLLRVWGLDLIAVQSFRLTWRSRGGVAAAAA